MAIDQKSVCFLHALRSNCSNEPMWELVGRAGIIQVRVCRRAREVLGWWR